jgi:hypothetical protein
VKKQVDLYVRPEWGIDWDGPHGAVAEANELLAQISPRSDKIHWLHCYYEPGERWQPVERLIVAEMVPRSILAGEDAFYRLMGEESPESLFSELEGPNPRDSGFYDRVLQKFVTRDGMLPPSITQRQWMLWRSEKAYARPFWIIQGEHGGHKRRFTETERKILRLNGKPDEPAYAGEFPFARFDTRILDKLKAMDRLQAWADERAQDWKSRTAQDAERSAIEAKERIDAQIMDWLDSQIADIAA